jgi:hypothetical protein
MTYNVSRFGVWVQPVAATVPKTPLIWRILEAVPKLRA